MSKGNKHSSKRSYKKNWKGSKWEKEARVAMQRIHKKNLKNKSKKKSKQYRLECRKQAP